MKQNNVSVGAPFGNKYGLRHGMSYAPEYRSWQAMKQRCLNAKDKDYKYYGKRGVKICKRWMEFENFLFDMGPRPPGTTLDRFPNKNGNYTKRNCRWATHKEQQNNKRIAVGERQGLAKLTEEKVRKLRRLVAQGFSQSAAARLLGVTPRAVQYVISGRTWRHVS